MPSPSDEARRRADRIKRRTKRLDGIFAFTSPEAAEPDYLALFTRGEAEQRASTLLAPLPALPGMVVEASKPAGPATEDLESAIEADPRVAALTLALGAADFFRRGAEAPGNLLQLIEHVGTAAFRNMTLVAFFHGLFDEELTWYGYEPRGLWRHLVAAGPQLAAMEWGAQAARARLAPDRSSRSRPFPTSKGNWRLPPAG